MNKETKLEELERRIASLERGVTYQRGTEVRLWNNIQTIARYLNIQINEGVFGVTEVKHE